MANWKRFSFGLASFVTILAFAIVLGQTVSIYYTGSVPPSGLVISMLVTSVLMLLLLALIARWRNTHPLLIWLPALAALPIFISVLVGVCPRCDWSMKQTEVGQGDLAVTYQTSSYAGVSQVSVVGEEGLWVADLANSRVALIDPVRPLVLREYAAGQNPVGIALGFDSIWTADYTGGTVTRIDPESGQKEAVISLGGNPLLLAVSEDSVWVTDGGSGVVTRIGPQTNAVTETITVSFRPVGIANSPEGVWVALSDINQVVLIDPGTNRVADRLFTASGPVNISIYEDQLWVASPSSGRVQRFDLASREKVADVNVGGEPTDVVADGRYAWVARSGADDVVRISLAGNTLVGDPLPTGDLPKTVVSDGHGGVWVMEEGARNVSHIVPTRLAPNAPEESPEDWFTSWSSVTLRTTALMATYGSPLFLFAGLLGLSAALAVRFYFEVRSDNGISTLETILPIVFLGLPLLGAIWDIAIALATTMAAIIAYTMVVRLSEPAPVESEGLRGVEDGAELEAA